MSAHDAAKAAGITITQAQAFLRAIREPGMDALAVGSIAVENSIDETSDSYSTYKIVDEAKTALAAWTSMVDALIRKAEG